MMNKKNILVLGFAVLMLIAVVVLVSASERNIDRERDEVANLTNAQGVDTLGALEVRSYRLVDENITVYGISAEQAEGVDPLLVSDWLDDKKIINYDNLVILLIKESQEQQITIDAMGTSLCNLGETRFC